MRYVFLGSPQFAVLILEKLVERGLTPLALISNPDRPYGRKKIITPPPVKQTVLERGWPVQILQPENLGQAAEDIRRLEPDFLLVAAFAKIIPANILKIPRLGALGVHPSLLPRHRGPTPIQSAIIAGDEVTGVTVYLLDEQVDHGPVLAKSEIRIAEYETYSSLIEKLSAAAGELLAKNLPAFLDGTLTPVPQDEASATYTKKFFDRDGFVEREKLLSAIYGQDPRTAESIGRKIRALNPEPGVWTTVDGKRLKILEAELETDKLALKKIQWEGKKPSTKIKVLG